jgi:peptide chain release factor subunit 1
MEIAVDKRDGMAITQTELDALIQCDSGPEGHILSVYLDTDQSRQANLNRGFVTALVERLRGMQQQIADENTRRKFWADAECVIAAVEKYNPNGRSAVFFCDTASNFRFERQLAVSIERTEVRWGRKPYIRPLVELFDEYERYAVVLVNKQQARLFTFSLGEIEENREVFSERRKRFKQTSKDNTLSSTNLQRREDEHTQLHMKEVADALETLASDRAFNRLVVGGPHELIKTLEARLSKRLQELVVGEISLPIDANEREVLEATRKIHSDTERRIETAAVEQLITAAAKDSQAALGLQPTLDAMRLGSIMRLVYVYNHTQPGQQCTKCESLFPDGIESCAFCGGAVRPVDDVVGRLVERVVHSGGQAESVRGEAADRLRPRGAVGAFLRF